MEDFVMCADFTTMSNETVMNGPEMSLILVIVFYPVEKQFRLIFQQINFSWKHR